jgi:hypothetical protein
MPPASALPGGRRADLRIDTAMLSGSGATNMITGTTSMAAPA